MNYINKILICILSFTFNGVVLAQNNFSAGMGNMQCKNFINLKKLNALKEPEGPILDWIQGYLTGINIVRLQKDLGDSIDIPERENLSQRIEGICYKDPENKILLVATEITRDLINQGKTFNLKKLSN